jgi:broad specificity phosphatase PhoE
MSGAAPGVSRIALVRHARSAHVHVGWVDAAGFRAWRVAYEAAGIADDERAPAALVALASSADLLLASDAPRALASARLLAPHAEVRRSALLRELALEGPALTGRRLPLALWSVAVGGRALWLRLRGQPPAPLEAARITAAVRWLEELAAQHALIVAVTHAALRGQLAARLVRNGWEAESGRRSLRPWSTWLFRRKPERV